MIEEDVIIIGGGPAGSTCGWKLKACGIDALILDKQPFPRAKLCAGWITPRVLKNLGIVPADYPGSLVFYNRITFYFKGLPLPIRTHQYAIRRYEFDDFLLSRSGARTSRHNVNSIRREDDCFIIDDKYRCRYLVGAGGTHCPVYKTFFRQTHPREDNRRIATAEIEFPYALKDTSCYLWFFDDGLPGYCWYVPKKNGYLNLGIGGKAESLKRNGTTIRDHWQRFVKRLEEKRLVSGVPEPRGHIYYLRQRADHVQIGNAFITGDSAGLATLDMGEGIGPAVESGLAAANSILTGRTYSLDHVTRLSAPQIIRYFFLRQKL